MPFEKVDPQADFPKLEDGEMLALWERIQAFEKLSEKNDGKPRGRSSTARSPRTTRWACITPGAARTRTFTTATSP